MSSSSSQPNGLDFISSQTVPSCQTRVKVINDPIHGHFELRDPVLRVIDTPHVQRLRDLKQLGTTYYVYPGASHNRFEHSVGVCHLSRSFVQKLYWNSRDPYIRSVFDGEDHFKHTETLVQLAGLSHDLGHGPFSHTFDHVFLPAVAEKVPSLRDSPLMKHEERSVRLFEHCVDEYNIDLTKEDIRAIGQLIRGDKAAGSLTPRFVYDIVANSSTGIDTDKFDYLARDVHNVGLQGAYGFDHSRLMNFAKVVDDNICFHRKEIFNVYHLFLTRFQLHRTVYNHRAAISMDAMVSDAFLHADSQLGISSSVFDPEEFLTVTDSLTTIIERSKDVALAPARNLIRRLRCRKLYRLVEEVLLPAGMSRRITPQQITTCQDSAGTGVILTPDDIYVAHISLNFGMKEKNPVDRVLFFKDWYVDLDLMCYLFLYFLGSDVTPLSKLCLTEGLLFHPGKLFPYFHREDMSPIHISSAKASYVLPAVFEENIIRIFVKREEDDSLNDVKKAVSVAFRNFMRRESLGASLNSPIMRKRTRDVADMKRCPVTPENVEELANGLGETMHTRMQKRTKTGPYVS